MKAVSESRLLIRIHPLIEDNIIFAVFIGCLNNPYILSPHILVLMPVELTEAMTVAADKYSATPMIYKAMIGAYEHAKS